MLTHIKAKHKESDYKNHRKYISIMNHLRLLAKQIRLTEI